MPSSDDLVRFANCSATRAASRSAATSGSAATTLPASRVSNLPHGSDPSTWSAIARSTYAAASVDRWRVLVATSLALLTRASRAITRDQIRGNRCRTSRASATNRRAETGLICIRAPSSA